MENINSKKQTLVISGKLPSRNDAENAARSHWANGAKIKREYTDLIYFSVLAARIKPIVGKATVDIAFYERDKRRDADNIIGGGVKYILDGLVKAGIIKDDSQKYLDLTIEPIKHDKLNPRIEIILTGVLNG